MIELAAGGDGPVKGERIAQAQEIPLKFLENILGDLRHAGVVREHQCGSVSADLRREKSLECE